MTGQRLGPYRVLDRIGTHDSYALYAALDEPRQREVVLAVISSVSEDARARILEDAQTATALDHPHLTQVLDAGETSNGIYVAMASTPGAPLISVLPPGGLNIDEALRVGLQVVDAVAHAHEHGVLHRALNSGNVVMTPDGTVSVLNVGITAPAAATTADLVAYLSPEQIRAQPATPASDVWALGVLLHELIAGERPFQGHSADEIASSILERQPRTLPHTVPTILRGLLSRCLAKDASRRYSNAQELHAALIAIRAASDPSPHVTATGRDQDRQRWWIVAGALGLIAGLMMFVLLARGLLAQ